MSMKMQNAAVWNSAEARGRQGGSRRPAGRRGPICPVRGMHNHHYRPFCPTNPPFGSPKPGLRYFRWNYKWLFSTACPGAFFNPKGIASFSPGLARFRESLPWVAANNSINPERVEYQSLMKKVQPFQRCDFSRSLPRVARSSQPWAESGNPVGIVTNQANGFKSLPHSTENGGEALNNL
jgi:hypothetical protein